MACSAGRRCNRLGDCAARPETADELSSPASYWLFSCLVYAVLHLGRRAKASSNCESDVRAAGKEDSLESEAEIGTLIMQVNRTRVQLALFVIIGPFSAAGFVLQMLGGCITDQGPEKMDFYNVLIFNKQLLAAYDAQSSIFMPCSARQGCNQAVHSAILPITNYLNQDGSTIPRMEAEMQACSANAQRFWKDTAQRTNSPNVQIALIQPADPWDLQRLACNVYDFYPKPINITWLKNGQKIPVYETSTTVRSNGDWSYQAQVYLPISPNPADVYHCQVQHSSLSEHVMKRWTPGLTQLQKIKISISVVVLALGLIFLLSGLLCWKKSRSDGYIAIPGDSYPEVS